MCVYIYSTYILMQSYEIIYSMQILTWRDV